MSELNVAAVLTPKPENFDEVRMILYDRLDHILMCYPARRPRHRRHQAGPRTRTRHTALLRIPRQERDHHRGEVSPSPLIAGCNGEHLPIRPPPSPCLGRNGRTRKNRHPAALTPDQIQEPGRGPGAHQSPLFSRIRCQAPGSIGEALGAARGPILGRFAGSVAAVENPSPRGSC